MKVLVVALVLAVLAGCSHPTTVPAPATDPSAAAGPANATRPTGDGVHGYMESYVMTHPFRRSGATQAFLEDARADLLAELSGFNLTAFEHAYDGRKGVNIVAMRNGTADPGQWVVFTAHYDTVAAGDTGATVYGAWDNGAGVATLLEMARATAANRYPFTVVFVFTDEEEQGLLGAAAFVAEYGDRPGVDLVANINTDPPGLNWPCGDPAGPFPVRIIERPSGDRYSNGTGAWLGAAIATGMDKAGVPEASRNYSATIPIAEAAGRGLGGTSDHAVFWDAGIPAAFLGGTPVTEAGPIAALTYGVHTPADTLQAMEARCTGGEGTLTDGFHTIVTTMAHALDAMAANPPPRGGR